MNNTIFKKMEHIGLGAVDTKALAKWYKETFNLHSLHEVDLEVPIYFLSDESNSFVIEIFPVKNTTNTDESIHFCFAVDDLEEAVTYLKDKGVETGEIRKLKSNASTLFFPDPVGHIIQVVHRPEKLW